MPEVSGIFELDRTPGHSGEYAQPRIDVPGFGSLQRGQGYPNQGIGGKDAGTRSESSGYADQYAQPGTTYWRLGHWKEAKGLQFEVLEARKQVLGLEHPHTLTSVDNLGMTYHHLGF